MSLILLPFLIVATHIIIELLTKIKHPFFHYMRIFTICLGWNIFFTSYLQADEVTNEFHERNIFFHECSMDIKALRESGLLNKMALRPHQTKEYTNKMFFHQREGQRCFREAETMCTLIPDEADKNAAIWLFSQALILSLNNCNFTAVVVTLETSLITYGIYQWGQWNKMQTKLLESKHHFEMSDFYKDILERA